jgi:hypothetical protein
MRELLTNSWVVGIVGGVLSGLFVTWISRIIFSKKDNKEYFQKILQANKEVIYAIRPTISEGEIPSKAIFESLIASNSIKYGIETQDMFSIEQICDRLIKEVMDSSFISSKVKTEYCQQLLLIKEEIIGEKVKREKTVGNKNGVHRENASLSAFQYRQRLVTYMTTLLGMMATLMTFLLTVFSKDDIFLSSNFFDKEYFILFPAIFVSFLILLMFTMLTVLTKFKKKLEKDSEENFFKKVKNGKRLVKDSDEDKSA